MELLILIAVIVLGLGYAFLPQILSLGLDDRAPEQGSREAQALREEKEKWIQGIVDLETEREVGNIEEDEFQRLRTVYKKRAVLAQQKLQHLDSDGDEPGDDQTTADRIERSIERKKSELAT